MLRALNKDPICDLDYVTDLLTEPAKLITASVSSSVKWEKYLPVLSLTCTKTITRIYIVLAENLYGSHLINTHVSTILLRCFPPLTWKYIYFKTVYLWEQISFRYLSIYVKYLSLENGSWLISYVYFTDYSINKK